MGLTDEQRETIHRNKERALQLRMAKLEKEQETKKRAKPTDDGTSTEVPAKKQKPGIDSLPKETEEDIVLESFEVGASEYVTKQEAMKMYCLPVGTLDVCAFIEKPNPRNGAWKPMKLYNRNEIRRRARKRFGGLDGLVAERRKREGDRFQKDMVKTKDFFR